MLDWPGPTTPTPGDYSAEVDTHNLMNAAVVIGSVVVVTTSIWAAIDAGRLIRSGVPPVMLGGGPAAVLVACLFLWIIAFPYYLMLRAGWSSTRKSSRTATAVVSAQSSGQPVIQPSPGWYVDPVGKVGLRYWNGEAWTHQERPAPPPIDGPLVP